MTDFDSSVIVPLTVAVLTCGVASTGSSSKARMTNTNDRDCIRPPEPLNSLVSQPGIRWRCANFPMAFG
jgi:hypothetical protein